MKTSLGQMDGNTWEDYCQKLLKIKYNDYQQVPSRFGGDLGIEGYTNSGIVFQCYCPDDDLFGKDLYDKQRDKITKDISKLIKNASTIAKLGPKQISEWHFLTPCYDNKDLLEHCRDKETEVILELINVINSSFKIFIKTEDDFIPERQIYVGAGYHKIQTVIENDDEIRIELEKLLQSENALVKNIRIKIEKLKLTENHTSQLIEQIVRGYIIGKNNLEFLNQKFPATFQNVIQLKAATELQLPIKLLRKSNSQGEILSKTLEEYESKLSSEYSSSLSSPLISNLANEVISDWLGRCPLDFNM